jgi:hypothetical protein
MTTSQAHKSGFTQSFHSPSTGDWGHTHPRLLNYLYLNGTFIYILACILSTVITKLVAEALVEIEILAKACESKISSKLLQTVSDNLLFQE